MQREEWQHVTLRDICERINYGYTASATREEVGPKFLRITDIVPELIDWNAVPFCVMSDLDIEKYALCTGDIVIARTGATTGYAKYIRNHPKSVFASYLVRIRIKNGIDNRFVGLVLESDEYKRFINANLGGAAQPQANAQVLTSYPLLLPPLLTQRKIAAILSAYDDLIENNTRRIAILEEIAQSLYREWFVHFRFPGHEKNTMVESPLGMIPEGWDVVRFTDIADVLSGGTPKTTTVEYWKGSIPFFTPRDAGTSLFVLETEKHITKAGLRACSSRLYPKNTIFITARGTVGKVLLNSVDMAMNQSCYALQGRDSISQYFVFMSIKNCIDQLKQNAHGAVFDTIIVDTFRMLVVVKPKRIVIDEFSTVVSPIFEQVLNLMNKNSTLRRTRDLLLPKLIAGELDVEALDIEVGGDAEDAGVQEESGVVARQDAFAWG